jgi:hypothetical protein
LVVPPPVPVLERAWLMPPFDTHSAAGVVWAGASAEAVSGPIR